MNKLACGLAALTVIFSLAACGKRDAEKPRAAPADAAERVFVGGPIYTELAGKPIVEAIAVKDGRIAAAGARADIDKSIGPDTEIIDLEGAALYPGFVDAHAHLLGIGMRELTLNLEGVASIEEMIDIVAAAAQETPEGETIYGRGWIETQWPEKRFPNRQDIDDGEHAPPDHP